METGIGGGATGIDDKIEDNDFVVFVLVFVFVFVFEFEFEFEFVFVVGIGILVGRDILFFPVIVVVAVVTEDGIPADVIDVEFESTSELPNSDGCKVLLTVVIIFPLCPDVVIMEGMVGVVLAVSILSRFFVWD